MEGPIVPAICRYFVKLVVAEAVSVVKVNCQCRILFPQEDCLPGC